MTLALGFLNPLLLWAVPLASVPIIIHLLNRRRFKRIRWAAMEHLLNALKRNRRRLRMEHWLLLALRTLAVLLLVFLVTRPQLSGSILGETRTHHVVLLDDSLSMAQRSGPVDIFDEARDRVVQLAERLSATRAGDLFSVLRTGEPTRPDLLGVRIGAQLTGQVRELVANLAVGDGSADMAPLLKAARERIDELAEAARAELYLITDLRLCDWAAAEGKPKPQLVAELEALDPRTRHLNIVPVGPSDTRNLAVVDVRHEGRVPVIGVPMPIAVEIKNQGITTSEPSEVAIVVDARSRVVRAIDPIEPGQSTTIEIAHTFHEAGFHGMLAALEPDRFPPDDQRSLALNVKEHSRVLLVDGDPDERAEDAETYYLSLALAPGGEGKSGVDVEVIPDHVLADHDLSDFDALWLVNVPLPGRETIDKLERFAADGGGVVIWVGDQVDAARYDEFLFRDGNGLLPAALLETVGDADRPVPVFMADDRHGSMLLITDVLRQLLSGVPIMRWMTIDEKSVPTARVVLRARDAGGAALMVSRNHGRGEVVLFTTTADTAWNQWQTDPSFQIVLLELHRTIAKQHSFGPFNHDPRGQLETEVHLGRYRPDVVVRDLQERGFERTFTAASDAEAELATLRVPMAEIRGFGLFELVLTPHAGGEETQAFARNPPVIEGELQKLSQASFFGTYPDTLRDRITFVDNEVSDTALLRAGQGEIWRLLALALLAALLIEPVLAWRFGRRGH